MIYALSGRRDHDIERLGTHSSAVSIAFYAILVAVIYSVFKPVCINSDLHLIVLFKVDTSLVAHPSTLAVLIHYRTHEMIVV